MYNQGDLTSPFVAKQRAVLSKVLENTTGDSMIPFSLHESCSLPILANVVRTVMS